MLKIVLNDLFINFKKSWVSILLYLILFYFLSVYTTSYVIVLSNNFNLNRETLSEFIYSKESYNIMIPTINVISVFTLFLITKKLPLRLSKVMFVCPSSDKDKMEYIYLQLLVKIILGFIFIFVSTYFMVGQFFINKGIVQNIIQLGLWLFLIITFNLKVGIGEEGLKKQDKNGYIILSKEEEMINYYFFAILLLETIIFYSVDAFNISFNIVTLVGWIVVFIINGYVIYKCISPIIHKSLSFEDVYRQIPNKEEGH